MVTSGSRKTDMAAAEMHSGYTFLKKSWWHINHVVPSHSQKKIQPCEFSVKKEKRKKNSSQLLFEFFSPPTFHYQSVLPLRCHCDNKILLPSHSTTCSDKKKGKQIYPHIRRHRLSAAAAGRPLPHGRPSCRGGERHRKRAARITAEESVKASRSSRKHWARRLLHLVIFTLNKAPPPLLINWCTSSF